MKSRCPLTIRPLASAALALGLLVGLAPSAQAAAPAPQWRVFADSEPTHFAAGVFGGGGSSEGEGKYFINFVNVGDAPTDGTAITMRDLLPASVRLLWVRTGVGEGGDVPCTSSPLVCTYPAGSPVIAPGEGFEMRVAVALRSGVSPGTSLLNSASISGGGAPPATASLENTVDPAPPPFGFRSLELATTNFDGTPYLQAGGHPYQLTVAFRLNTKFNPMTNLRGESVTFPVEQAHDLSVDLPPGMIGNPQVVPKCAGADFFTASCPADTQLGTIRIKLRPFDVESNANQFVETDLYNLVPQPGEAARFGLLYGRALPVFLVSGLHGAEYAVRTTNHVLANEVTGAFVTFWGVPADPRHDPFRGAECSLSNSLEGHGYGDWCSIPGGLHSDQPLRAFLTLPTSCPSAPLPASATSDSWENPGVFTGIAATMEPAEGCNAVPFHPSLEARPTTPQPDAPSGLDVDLKVPQEGLLEPEGVASADLRETTIALPAGMRLNPASANGLSACSETQVGYLPGPVHPFQFTEGAPACPEASKLGAVEVDTPLLDHPLPGSVYLAKPHENPFGSLLALYIVIDDPESGVIVKLPAAVHADPQTGQLTTTVEESPQLPFEEFHLHFFKGATAALRTPSVCGTYTSTSVLTPWSAPESGPPAEPSDQFTIAGSCAASEAAEPNTPSFDAGTESPQAGKFSPFAFKLVRSDGTQEFSRIETVLPPGLSGKLAGIPYCPESAIALAKSREHDGGGAEEIASPSCPASSEIGKVEVGAGAGPDPYYTSGHAYLAGPYGGAPLSLVTIVPAVAGPFDLGNVVTRVALHVDPRTTQLTAVSDPLPHIIDGIPLDVRSITLKLDRPQFTLNPTSCNPMSIGGSATSVFGQPASLTQAYQAVGCKSLAFKPKLVLALKGATKRSGFPALKATLTMKPGEANVAAAQVTLPHASFLANAHIDKTCGHPELEANTCPPTSVYGHARAWSPLLEQPLEGKVYLVTGFGFELPALVADLNGQIDVHLVGKVDTGREDGIRNTFEVVPDAPVSKFVLEMSGGKKSLIENSKDLCAKRTKRKALAEFTAQNGKVWDTEPVVKNGCKHRRQHHKKR